jgi:hypothetical protein
MTGGPTLAEFLGRVALALPLVLLLAVAVLLAWKRWGHRLGPGSPVWRLARPGIRLPMTVDAPLLRIEASVALAPGVRLVAVRFEDRLLLLGVSGHGLQRIETGGQRP